MFQNHHALPTHGNRSVAFLHDPNQVWWYGFLKGKTVYGVRQKDGTQKFPHFDQPDPSEIFFVPSFCATPYRFLALYFTVPTHLVCFVQKRDKRVPDPPGSDGQAKDSEPPARVRFSSCRHAGGTRVESLGGIGVRHKNRPCRRQDAEKRILSQASIAEGQASFAEHLQCA